MKRSGFKAKLYERTPRAPLVLTQEPPRATMQKAALFKPVPKGVKAKPGKRTPNALEARWMDAIVSFGCIACLLDGEPGTPAAVHHLVVGNRRLGHGWTIPLCDPGHHQNGKPLGRISIHPGRSPAFIQRYGTERELLERLQRILGFNATGDQT